MQDIDLFDEIGKRELPYMMLYSKDYRSIVNAAKKSDDFYKAFFLQFDALATYAYEGEDTDLPEKYDNLLYAIKEAIYLAKKALKKNHDKKAANGAKGGRKRAENARQQKAETENDADDDEVDDDAFDGLDDEAPESAIVAEDDTIEEIEEPPFRMTKAEFSELFAELRKSNEVSSYNYSEDDIYARLNGKKQKGCIGNWKFFNTFFMCREDVRDYLIVDLSCETYLKAVKDIEKKHGKRTTKWTNAHVIIHDFFFNAYYNVCGIKCIDENGKAKNQALFFALKFAEWYFSNDLDVDIQANPNIVSNWLYDEYINAPAACNFAPETVEAIIRNHNEQPAQQGI